MAAARCNMFSHVLVAYQAALLEFASKTSHTYNAALKILAEKQHYNFTILKDLTQAPVIKESIEQDPANLAALDFDQMLFFKVKFNSQQIQVMEIQSHPLFAQEEYEDKDPLKEETPISTEQQKHDVPLKTSIEQLIDTNIPLSTNDELQSNLDDLLGICDSTASDSLFNLLDDSSNLLTNSSDSKSTKPSNAPLSNFSFDLFGKLSKSNAPNANKIAENSASKPSKSDKKTTAWFDLFAELDPLANPSAIEQKLAGSNKNYLDA